MGLDKEIYKIFVTTKDLKAKGSNISQLAEGEVGFFDANTNLTIADADITTQGRYFFATRLGDKIVKSPNRWIGALDITSVAQKAYTAPSNKKVELKDFKVFCGKEYVLNILIDNEEVKFTQGTNLKSVLLTGKTADCQNCKDSDPCAEIDSLLLIKQLLGNVKSKYVDIKFTISATQGTHNAGTVITKENIDILIAYNVGKASSAQVKATMTIEAIPLPKDNHKDGYFKVRNTDFTVVLKEGFIDNVTVTEVTKNVVEQGLGFDINHLEWKQQQMGSRKSNYGDFETNPQTFAVPTEQYEMISMVYSNKAQVGPFLYDHPNELIIAIKGTSTNLKKVVKKLAENAKATISGTL